MATVIRTEKRKRGIFGTIVWWAFLAFQALMALVLYHAITGAADVAQTATDAGGRAGAAIGGTLAAGFLLMVWLIGSLILGIIVLLSRGKTVTTERTIEDRR